MRYTKYIDALIMMDDIVTNHKNASDIHSDEYNAEEAICTQWDKLYEYVFANFKSPKSLREADVYGNDSVTVTPEVKNELASINEMLSLNREEIEAQLYEIPPVILEQCFPVWLARYMLYTAGIPVHSDKLETLTKFCQWYGYMVIYS